MNMFRFAIAAVAAVLAVSLGPVPASTTTNSPSVPGNPGDTPALDLRAVGSQLVVETIEDALRQGGLSLLGEGFQLDSSLSYANGDTGGFRGEWDVVVPLFRQSEYVVFVQPGVVFWTGHEEESRIDGNLGFVYRANLANTPLGIDAVGGASLFYDWDFRSVGHSRLGIGADIQSGIFHGAFNYYYPLSGVQEGLRDGFVEEALQGMDLRFAFEKDVMRAGASLGYWGYDGGEGVPGEWGLSVGFDAGVRILPGVFLEGGWERYEEGILSDQRWNAGLAFRFSLPDFGGIGYGSKELSSSLWKPVEREKRILYEERLGTPQIDLTPASVRVFEPETEGESETVTIMADLGRPLEEDVTLNITVEETSTAEFGADRDFTYGYKVYERDAVTGGQSAPEGDATACGGRTCAVTIPAGVTRFHIEAEIFADGVDQESPEFIGFQIEVPEEHADLLRGSDGARVFIGGSGNIVSINSDVGTRLDEDGGTLDIVVDVLQPSPDPITLNVAAASTSTAQDGDYSFPATIEIPAYGRTGTVTITGIDNIREETAFLTVDLEITGGLPEGWDFVDDSGDPADLLTHQVTIFDDDVPWIGWVVEQATIDTIDGRTLSYIATARMTEPLSDAVTLNVNLTTQGGLSSGSPGMPAQVTDCTEGFFGSVVDITFPANATGDDLMQSCLIHVTEGIRGGLVILELVAAPGARGFIIDRPRLTIMGR
ncbi:MAG: inverse autotransporter beta domain-containing protein [Hyphomicrobiales bacterium]|nr:inverse autotransporter beta domain-containing protein [Hyphomicrobiales bacterium]